MEAQSREAHLGIGGKASGGVPRQCVLLAGGWGDPCGGAPQPPLTVADRPFLDPLIGEAVRFGIEHVVLLCGCRAGAIADHYREDRDHLPASVELSIVVAPEAAGSGGALAHAAPLLDDVFFLADGGSWFDINLLDLGAWQADAGWTARLALRAPPPEGRPGGVAVLRREVLDWIGGPQGSLDGDVFPRLAAAGRLASRIYDGAFFDGGGSDRVRRQRTRPAVFLDRDGVLNRDDGYVHRIEDLVWVDGAVEAVKLLNDRGWYVFVVTNQSGVAQGYYQEPDIHRFHAGMAAVLRRQGAHIDAFEYSPFHPEARVEAYRRDTDCRKPGCGMILRCLDRWPVDRAGSFLVGDRVTDIQAAAAAGLPGHLFSGGNLRDFIAALLP